MPEPRQSVLRVDLTGRTVERAPVPESWRRLFLGGKGLGARYLYEELEAGADPLGPANLLGFMLGPLSGYLPGETRYAAVTKSPLTGGFLDSYAGGEFPARLAGTRPGCLGLLVTGRADEPVTLRVTPDECAVVAADDLVGADAEAVAAAFPDAAVACVGPAGEAGVAYATIASDGGDHHAGRGGAGAVMFAKNLKAVVVRGDPPEPTGDLARLHDRYAATYRDHDTGRWLAAGGTIESLDFAEETGLLAARGWQESGFDGSEAIGIEAAEAANDPVTEDLAVTGSGWTSSVPGTPSRGPSVRTRPATSRPTSPSATWTVRSRCWSASPAVPTRWPTRWPTASRPPPRPTAAGVSSRR